MISQIFKKGSLLAALAASSAIYASDADSRQNGNSGQRTRMVQVVISPSAQGFQFQFNNGVATNGNGTIVNATNLVSTTNGGLVTPITLRPGSTSRMTGLIFPAGTVDPSQASFNVSQSGMPLTQQNSIGTFSQTSTTLAPITFTQNPVNGNTFPVAGTTAEQVQWLFNFNGNNCCMQGNNGNRISTITANGELIAGNFGSNQAAFVGENLTAVQAGNNSNGTNAIRSAQVFFSQDLANPQMLINVELQDQIRI